MPRKPSGKPRGGQPGNRNALKTGLHTAELRKMRADAWKRIVAVHAAAAAAQALTAAHCAVHRERPSIGENTGRQP